MSATYRESAVTISPFLINNPIIVGFVSLARSRREVHPDAHDSFRTGQCGARSPVSTIRNGDGRRTAISRSYAGPFFNEPDETSGDSLAGQRRQFSFGCVSHNTSELFGAS